MKRFFISGFAFLMMALPVSSFGSSLGSSLGYEEIAVVDGGTLTGTVTLKGPIPPPVAFSLNRSPFSKFCERISDGHGKILLKEYRVGEATDGLQDTIVAVQRVPAGKHFAPIRASFFATDCMFHPAEVAHHEMHETDHSGKRSHVHPLVTVFQDRQAISVINQDPIFHNAQLFQQDTGRVLLNFPIPVSDRPIGGLAVFQKGKKLVQIICGMHEYMQAYGMVVDNPYYAKTKQDGRFLIDQLPKGTYQVMAWHPHFKPIMKEIIVSAGGAITLDFEFESKEVKPRLFESAEGLRTISFTEQFNN